MACGKTGEKGDAPGQLRNLGTTHDQTGSEEATPQPHTLRHEYRKLDARPSCPWAPRKPSCTTQCHPLHALLPIMHGPIARVCRAPVNVVAAPGEEIGDGSEDTVLILYQRGDHVTAGGVGPSGGDPG